jgi:hypothetical protein
MMPTFSRLNCSIPSVLIAGPTDTRQCSTYRWNEGWRGCGSAVPDLICPDPVAPDVVSSSYRYTAINGVLRSRKPGITCPMQPWGDRGEARPERTAPRLPCGGVSGRPGMPR